MKTTASAWPLFLLALVLGAQLGPASAQQNYPTKPIRFIVPYAPGGSTSTVARLVGQKLTERWGQQVLVDNRGGGNTIIGSELLVKSPADGYTILLVTATHAINPALLPTPYDAIRDFAPVATLVGTEYLMAINPAVPAANLKEFIALARARPGQINYGSSGSGTTNHLAGELLNLTAGIRLQHVPYKGGGPALADLLGGQVQMLITTVQSLLPHIRAGKLRPIAMTGAARSPALPNTPSFAEEGMPAISINSWFGVLAPAATPREIVERLSAEFGRILVLPDLREKFAAEGVEPFISTPEQFAALIKADVARFATLIKSANIRIEP